MRIFRTSQLLRNASNYACDHCSVAVASEDTGPPAALEPDHRIEEGNSIHAPGAQRALRERVFSDKGIQHVVAGHRYDRLRGAPREFEVLRGASDVAITYRSVLRLGLSVVEFTSFVYMFVCLRDHDNLFFPFPRA